MTTPAQTIDAGLFTQVITRKQGKKTVTLCTASARRTTGSKFILTCNIGTDTRKAMKKGKVKVAVRYTNKPDGGTPKVATASLTLPKAG